MVLLETPCRLVVEGRGKERENGKVGESGCGRGGDSRDSIE